MKNPLNSCHIAIGGDFGPSRSNDTLKKWIQVNGGTVAKTISLKTTHLVCSKEVWKRQTSIVESALKHKGIKIVSYDWLENSLHHRKCRATRKYLWSALARKEKHMKQEQKLEKERIVQQATTRRTNTILDDKVRIFKAGCELAQKDLLSENHHLYRDSTGFVYNIILFRSNIENNFNERHRLSLYESNVAPPYLHACTSTYYVPGRKKITHILTNTGIQYDTAFKAWRQFFKSRTGVDWDYRFYSRQVQDLKSHEKVDLRVVGREEPLGDVHELSREEKNGGRKKKYFVYVLPDPEKGEPLGEMTMMRQAVERFGPVPNDMQYVGGQAKDSDIDLDDDDSEADAE